MVGLNDIISAREVIAGRLHRTPLLSATLLGKRVGVPLYFKAEVFQKTGSFKPRGSVNKLSRLSEVDRRRGVVTVSSGNHAQGLAYAASLFGIPATVVMDKAAVPNKVEATRGYGAEVILTDGDIFKVAAEIQKERGLIFIHPFDDPDIVAGHGTAGLEILDDLPEVDVVFIPIGGGGLISGIATAIKSKKPAVKVIGVEPTGAAGMSLSLKAGKVVPLAERNTVADGLQPPSVGELNLALVKQYVDEVVLVSDEEIIEAMGLILEWSKVLTEPSGAASFAALLFGRASVPSGAAVVCVLSGGNINRSRLVKLLAE